MLARPVMTVETVREFLVHALPQIDGTYAVEAVGPLNSRVRRRANARHLRPGGTIWGPTMMELADVSLYAAIVADIGPAGLAVTIHLACDFRM
jgi:acyl-coenzyme A thioesterase PaaI-like protein